MAETRRLRISGGTAYFMCMRSSNSRHVVAKSTEHTKWKHHKRIQRHNLIANLKVDWMSEIWSRQHKNTSCAALETEAFNSYIVRKLKYLKMPCHYKICTSVKCRHEATATDIFQFNYIVFFNKNNNSSNFLSVQTWLSCMGTQNKHPAPHQLCTKNILLVQIFFH